MIFPCNLDVVIVTYNRIEKLKKCLSLYESQTVLFRTLIIVDNNSTDGTRQYVDEWAKLMHKFNVVIRHLNKNVGGSGGFYEGQRIAESLNADWILLADDDAYPDVSLIEKFYRIVENLDIKTPAICTQVQNIDNTIDCSHRRTERFRKGQLFRENIPVELYRNKFFKVDLFSYVGAFVRVDSIRRVGFVNPRFFIYEDDGEHSLRLKSLGDILCFPELIYVHDSGQNQDLGNLNKIVTWRDYYALRNFIYVCIHNRLYSAFILTIYNIVKILFRNEPQELKRLKWDALKDAWLNRLGIHEVYKPGWEVVKNNKDL